MENKKMNTQYNAIDLTKFLCAILVVTIHVAPFGNYETSSLLSCFYFGIRQYLARIAVPFFFVTSGFFLYRKTSFECFHVQPTKKYALKLLKLYMIWSAIYFPFNFILFFRDEKGILHAILVYIKDYILSGSYRHLWYLNATIFAVAFISLLLHKKVTLKKMMIAACALYLGGLLAQSWFGFIAPLKETAPYIWNMLKFIQKIIVTTRNGLFEGFLFVGIGMLFAFNKVHIPKKLAYFGFVFSMLLLFIEVFVLQYFHIAREHDTYFFLVPTVFFMFSIVCDMHLPDHKTYKSLRTLSSLIFYMHVGVSTLVKRVLEIISNELSETILCFLLTLIITIICSVIVMKLSKFSKFGWLKQLYA